MPPSANRLRTALRAVEAAAVAAALSTAAFAAARTASPYILPVLHSSIRGASAWIAVQFIVFVIWKLSRHKSPTVSPTESPPTVLDLQNPSSDLRQDTPVSPIDTEVSERDSPRILEIKKLTIELSPASRRHEMRKSATVKDRRIPSRPPPEIVSIKEQEDNSMDATWNAIMAGSASPGRPVLRKSDTWEVPPPPQAARPEMRKSATFREGRGGEGWREREALVVGRDELFGRVEAFIQMHYDHLRLQRQESEQQRRLIYRNG